MRFSILIATLRQRSALLDRLMGILEPQLNDQVEVLLEPDSGEITTGTKRNKLVARAKGDYVAFIDDDDRVASDYVSRILGALESSPDCVGIEGIWTSKDQERRFIASLRYKTWHEANGLFLRSPNHINPVVRTIASQVPFPDKVWGEDSVYSEGILPHLKTEVYLDGDLYFYDHNPNK